jgi:hypothetical protein
MTDTPNDGRYDCVDIDAAAEAVLQRMADSDQGERCLVVRDASGTIIDVISVADLDET